MSFYFDEETLRSLSDEQMTALISTFLVASASGPTVSRDDISRLFDKLKIMPVVLNPRALEEILMSAKQRYDTSDDDAVDAWLGEMATLLSDPELYDPTVAAIRALALDSTDDGPDTILAANLAAFKVAPQPGLFVRSPLLGGL